MMTIYRHAVSQGGAPAPRPASADLKFTKDRMEAELVLLPPEGGGAEYTEETLLELLHARGVVHGIDMPVLQRLVANPAYNVPLTIARGTPPAPGQPARIENLVKLDKDIRPHEREDGTVDYKDLGILTVVVKGQPLCRKHPAKPPVPGRTVMGQEVPGKAERDVPLPVGKNTAPSPDGLFVLAAMDGECTMVNNRYQVRNVFTVSENVGMATGNIDFPGHVVVNGSVLNGYTVRAEGNITVNGTVEAAELYAGGDILVKQGINGFGKGLISAEGSVKANFIQAANIKAKGSVEANYILHSQVQAGADVTVVSKKGNIVGGRVTAFRQITTAYAGGRNTPVLTVLEVGTNPELAARAREIPALIKQYQADIARFDRVIDLLGQLHAAGRLDDDKRSQLEQSVAMHTRLVAQVQELEYEQEELKEQMESFGYGYVNITQAANPHVRIMIGSVSRLLENSYDRCTFSRDPAGVVFGPLHTRAGG